MAQAGSAAAGQGAQPASQGSNTQATAQGSGSDPDPTQYFLPLREDEIAQIHTIMAYQAPGHPETDPDLFEQHYEINLQLHRLYDLNTRDTLTPEEQDEYHQLLTWFRAEKDRLRDAFYQPVRQWPPMADPRATPDIIPGGQVPDLHTVDPRRGSLLDDETLARMELAGSPRTPDATYGAGDRARAVDRMSTIAQAAAVVHNRNPNTRYSPDDEAFFEANNALLEGVAARPDLAGYDLLNDPQIMVLMDAVESTREETDVLAHYAHEVRLGIPNSTFVVRNGTAEIRVDPTVQAAETLGYAAILGDMLWTIEMAEGRDTPLTVEQEANLEAARRGLEVINQLPESDIPWYEMPEAQQVFADFQETTSAALTAESAVISRYLSIRNTHRRTDEETPEAYEARIFGELDEASKALLPPWFRDAHIYAMRQDPDGAIQANEYGAIYNILVHPNGLARQEYLNRYHFALTEDTSRFLQDVIRNERLGTVQVAPRVAAFEAMMNAGGVRVDSPMEQQERGRLHHQMLVVTSIAETLLNDPNGRGDGSLSDIEFLGLVENLHDYQMLGPDGRPVSPIPLVNGIDLNLIPHDSLNHLSSYIPGFREAGEEEKFLMFQVAVALGVEREGVDREEAYRRLGSVWRDAAGRVQLPTAQEIRGFSTALPTDGNLVQGLRAGIGTMMTTVAGFGLAVPNALQILSDGRPDDPGARRLAAFASILATPFSVLDSAGRAVVPAYATEYTQMGEIAAVMVTHATVAGRLPQAAALLGAVQESVQRVYQGIADGTYDEEEAATALTVDLWASAATAVVGRLLPDISVMPNPQTFAQRLIHAGGNAAGAMRDEAVNAAAHVGAGLMFDADNVDLRVSAVELFSDTFDALLEESITAVAGLDPALAVTLLVHTDLMAAAGEKEEDVHQFLSDTLRSFAGFDTSTVDGATQAVDDIQIALMQNEEVFEQVRAMEAAIARMNARSIAGDLVTAAEANR